MSRLTILALGLMPYISAYLVVEICSLGFPFLRKHRGDHLGRTILKRYALFITVLFGAAQGFAVVRGLSDLRVQGADMFTRNALNEQGPLVDLLLVVTLVGGVFVIIFLSELISRYGVGHGISILIITGDIGGLSRDLGRLVHTLKMLRGFPI